MRLYMNCVGWRVLPQQGVAPVDFIAWDAVNFYQYVGHDIRPPTPWQLLCHSSYHAIYCMTVCGEFVSGDCNRRAYAEGVRRECGSLEGKPYESLRVSEGNRSML